jgi:TPR repeat protein
MKAIIQAAFLALVLMLAPACSENGGPFEDGKAAYDRGDYATALEFWRPLAEQGNAKLQVTVGLMYEKGLGVPQDFVRAHMWFILAVAQGHEEAKQDRDRTASLMAPDQIAAAQTHLGYMYDIGRGVPQDYVEAAKWYRMAAEQGDASAQSNLGIMYRRGLGVPQDDAEAVKWFRLAAEQGITQAQYNLGNRYANGQGLKQDIVQAHMWFSLAAEQGSEKAKENRDIAARKMTPDQIVEAQRMAREWMAEHQQ